MNYYLIDFNYLPIINVGHNNDTIYINENFQQIFISSLSIDEIRNKINEVVQTNKMGIQKTIEELKFLDFNYSYFTKDLEGNPNWKIYELTDFLKGMISKI